MAVTVQMQFTSVVTEMYQDAFVGSSIENGATIIQFDLRQRNYQLIIPNCQMSPKFLKLLKKGHENVSRETLGNRVPDSICA